MTKTPVLAPVEGRAVPLAEVPDPVFSQGMVGYGAAIDPPRRVIDATGQIVIPGGTWGHLWFGNPAL